MARSLPALLVSLLIASSSPALALERKLLSRQLDVPNELICKTCSECYGEGYLICSYVGCYNPSEHQQCCADANLCVAKDNSCCDDFGGPGVSATTDGTPLPTSLYTPSYTPTGTPFSFDCYPEESGEECCSKSNGLIYCPASGGYPNIACYHPTDQTCCSDGTICYGKDCCDLVSASQITPTYTIPGTGGPPTSTTAGSIASGGTEPTGTTTTTTSSSTGIAAVRNVLGDAAPVALGILGVAAML
ncbi:hypothetical protein FQN53_004679 [Emmonsiellopsis sp. PD_33]|nr:hypothetical protein FQN53_004679 [Emmonsiellopsis sp. PD_33]